MSSRAKIGEAVVLGLIGTGVAEAAHAIGGAATGRSSVADFRAGQVTGVVLGVAGAVAAGLAGDLRLFLLIAAVGLALVGLYELLHRRSTGRG